MIRLLLNTVLLCIACVLPAAAQLTATNLPIIHITTTIPVGGSQSPANMSIINNSSGLNHPGDAPEFSGMIGIKWRGNASLPKLSYTLETWYSYKNEMDTSLLGMPSENDWVLLAMYPDRSLMRNLLATHVYEQMGYWSPRTQLVELMMDGVYKGVYLFGETIKRDTLRLDLSKLKSVDNTYPQISGGYILKIDADDGGFFSSAYPPGGSEGQTIKFYYDYPKDDVITGIQKAWIKNYVDSFENRLQGPDFADTVIGWRSHASHKSFRDYFILNEALGNAEGYRLNTYVWKDKEKKLRVGPPWNWNLALYNSASCHAATDTAWMHRHAQYCPADTFLPPFWWQRLQEDPSFVQEVTCRYQELRQPGAALDTNVLFAWMDSVSNRLNAQGAQSRNFSLYPIFGTPLGDEPTPLAANYAEEVSRVKQYLKLRLSFLDLSWQGGDCSELSIPQLTSINDARIAPNPTRGDATLSFYAQRAGDYALTLYDHYGQIFRQWTRHMARAGEQSVPLPAGDLPAGVYLVKMKDPGGATVVLRLVKW